jgi:hypothetical protein
VNTVQAGTAVSSVLTSLWADVNFGSAGNYVTATIVGGTHIGISNDLDTAADLVTPAVPAAYSTVLSEAFTYWAVGGVGNATNPPSILVCRDTATASAPTLDCNKLLLAAPLSNLIQISSLSD